ncbi:TrmH family RNA methyltransferase [Mycoplasmatota bacterium zrk1]
MIDIRDYSLEEKENHYKEKYKYIYNVGRTHKVIRNIFNINNNKKPNPHNFIVLESYEVIRKAILNNVRFEYLVVCPEEAYTPEAQKIVDEVLTLCKEGYVVSKKTFESIMEKKNSFGVIVVAKFPLVNLDDFKIKENMKIVVLDGLEIQGNVGTIIRSADGAGVDLVILTNKRIRISHPKFIKSSMGTCLNIPIVVGEMSEVHKWLSKNNFNIYLTDTRAKKNYFEDNYEGNVAIVAGSERYGIMKKWYEAENVKLVKIPMLGQADSLNVGVATSIIIYEVLNKKDYSK